MDKAELRGAIEAILYVSGEPVEEEALRMALEVPPEDIREALDTISSQYDYDRRGIRLLRFGQSVQLSTRPDYAQYVERLLQPIQRQNLSQAAMETLAVIAYRQPATRGDVEAIRGVKCDYSVQSLLNKGLIGEAGRRDTLGRPTLFVTTDAFLRHFGISSLEELPQIEFTPEGLVPAEELGLPGETGVGEAEGEMAGTPVSLTVITNGAMDAGSLGDRDEGEDDAWEGGGAKENDAQERSGAEAEDDAEADEEEPDAFDWEE